MQTTRRRKGTQVCAAVRKVLTQHEGRYLSGGHSNAFTTVRCCRSDDVDAGNNWCYNPDCRITLLADDKRACEHVKAVQQHLESNVECTPSPGLALTGFYAFVHHAMEREKRHCTQAYCIQHKLACDTPQGKDPQSSHASAVVQLSAEIEGELSVDDIMGAKKKQLLS